MEKRRRGRPRGTTKGGDKTPEMMLALLRTKTWAWTCANYLSDDDAPLSRNALSKEANKFSSSPRNPVYSYDAARWSRWLRGLRRAYPETVLDLWGDVQGAFFVGPWVGSDDGSPYGGFVPLWNSLIASPLGLTDLRKKWKEIPRETWETWGPTLVSGEETPYPTAFTDPDFVPDAQDFRSSQNLFNFLTRIAAKKCTPPLLAFSAAISLARIDERKRILFFDPNPSVPYSLHTSIRTDLIRALEKISLSFAEIANVSEQFGLEIYDCGLLSYQQYIDLSLGTSPRRGLRIYDRESISEEEWRDIFGTT